MSELEFQQAFSREFASFFRDHGFEAKQWDLFARTLNDVEQLISIGPRRRSSDGYGITAGGFGVRLVDVENLRRREIGHEGPTVAIPLHLLKPDRSLQEWPLSSPRDVAAVADEIKRQIEQYGFPFLAANASKGAVLNRIAGADWNKWFVCTPDARDAILVYASWLSSGPEVATSVAKKALKQYESRPMKYSIELRRAAEAAQRAARAE